MGAGTEDAVSEVQLVLRRPSYQAAPEIMLPPDPAERLPSNTHQPSGL